MMKDTKNREALVDKVNELHELASAVLVAGIAGDYPNAVFLLGDAQQTLQKIYQVIDKAVTEAE